jgi:hypothetical protein
MFQSKAKYLKRENCYLIMSLMYAIKILLAAVVNLIIFMRLFQI